MKLLGRLGLGVILLLSAWPLVRGYHSARFEYGNFHLPRTHPQRPADASALRLEDVQFTGAGGTILRGWYIPSRTGAAVVLAAGSGGDRTMLLDQARVIAAGGTGALLFDWPGCGESEGEIGAGAAERAAVRGAVDFVASRPDVQAGRIGLLGFSLGSWAALLEGERDARVASFVLQGVFDDPRSQTMVEYAPSGRFAQWGAVLGERLAGMDQDPGRASLQLAAVSPRPIAFVTGTLDRVVPPALTRALHATAREPKELWVIEGATHGDYATVDPGFGPRLRAFVERTLTPARDSTTARR